MKYQIIITKNAKKDISKLNPLIQKRIKAKLIYFLSLNNPLVNAEKLKNHKYGEYRWRMGVYRIIFDIDGDNIILLSIGHRRNIYDK